MARVKPPKDVINKHVESALISAIRLRRYWISQGNSEDEAIKKAIKQATGMLSSTGISPEELLKLFEELKEACEAFISSLQQTIKEK
ncbi:MAG: hypothetical protein QXV60_02620 [Nitrososphaerota archaeon]